MSDSLNTRLSRSVGGHTGWFTAPFINCVGSCSTANSILRLAVDGRIVMFFRPPGFSQEKGIHLALYASLSTLSTHTVPPPPPPHTHTHTHTHTCSQLGAPSRGGRYDPASAEGSAWSTWRGGGEGGRGRYPRGHGEGGAADEQVCTSDEIGR